MGGPPRPNGQYLPLRAHLPLTTQTRCCTPLALSRSSHIPLSQAPASRYQLSLRTRRRLFNSVSLSTGQMVSPAPSAHPVQTDRSPLKRVWSLIDRVHPAIAVAWNTYEQLSNACVQYGTDTGLSQTQCSKTSITYPSSRTWSNLVVLENLQPATRYCESPHALCPRYSPAYR